jgi:cysteinyl-tRNA synthetase
MSVAYLGAPFDIHTGGVDHIPVHHENEIAQTEAALDTTMSTLWMHGEFLLVDGGRMGKSLGNAYTLQDLETRAVHPLALRYLFLNAHYRSKQNFTWEALAAAQNSLRSLREIASSGPADGKVDAGFSVRFGAALADDLNLPQALAVTWEAARSDTLTPADRSATLRDFDRVLGLGLGDGPLQTGRTLAKADQAEVERLVAAREQARADKQWQRADEIRDQLKAEFGVTIEDTAAGTVWSAE